jgi:hypothetical protein
MTHKTESAGPVLLCVVLPASITTTCRPGVGQPKIAHAAAPLHLQYIPPSYAIMHLSLALLEEQQRRLSRLGKIGGEMKGWSHAGRRLPSSMSSPLTVRK